MKHRRVEGSWPFRVSFQVVENRGPPHPCPLPKERELQRSPSPLPSPQGKGTTAVPLTLTLSPRRGNYPSSAPDWYQTVNLKPIPERSPSPTGEGNGDGICASELNRSGFEQIAIISGAEALERLGLHWKGRRSKSAPQNQFYDQIISAATQAETDAEVELPIG